MSVLNVSLLHAGEVIAPQGEKLSKVKKASKVRTINFTVSVSITHST